MSRSGGNPGGSSAVKRGDLSLFEFTLLCFLGGEGLGHHVAIERWESAHPVSGWANLKTEEVVPLDPQPVSLHRVVTLDDLLARGAGSGQ